MTLIPFKWVGGKGKLAKLIGTHFPEKFGNYYEPFCGGAAVFFNNRDKIKFDATLSDLNVNVIVTLEVIRNNREGLIVAMRKIIDDGLTEEKFYALRDKDRNDGWTELSDVEVAARFMVINRTGYCGLWRENSKGQCNTPYGHYKNPKVLIEDDLRKCSEALLGVWISLETFDKAIAQSFVKELQQERDSTPLYYLDPPYVNYEKNGAFSAYNKGDSFSDKENVVLADWCKKIDRTQGKFIQSNLFSERIIELYGGWCKIHPIESHHSISTSKSRDGKVREVLIKNF